MKKIICFLFGHKFVHKEWWDYECGNEGKTYRGGCDICERCVKIKNYKLKP